MSPNKENIIRNTTYLTGAFIGQKLFAFIYFVFIARFLGAEQVGLYTVALSFTTIFSIFIDIGASPVLTREIAQDKEKFSSLLRTILSSKLILSCIVYGLVIGTIYLFDYPLPLKKLIFISGFVMIIDSFILSIYSALRGLHILKYEAIGIILGQFITMSVGLFGLFFIKKDPVILMYAFLFGGSCNLFFALYQLRKKYNFIFKPFFDRTVLRNLYIMALPFSLSGLFTRIYSYIDSIILHRFLGDSAVGFYTVAYKIPFALQFIPSAMAASLYPAMSSYYEKEKDKLARSWERATIYLLILAMPMLVGLYLLADVIILRFYGDAFSISIVVLRTLVLGLVFIFLNFPLGSLLASCHKQKVNTMLIGITMLINVLGNIYLIPKVGIVGAAYSFLLSHSFLFLSTFFYATFLIKINFRRLLWVSIRILFAAFIMGVIVAYVKNNFSWIFSILAGVIFYPIFILCFDVMSIQGIKRIFQRT